MSNALAQLMGRSVEDLRATAQDLGLDVLRSTWKARLVTAISQANAPEDTHYGCGVLEVHSEGFGFLRSVDEDLLPSAGDIYVSQSQIRRFHLLTGHTIIGRIRPPKDQERYPALLRVELVEGAPADVDAPHFDTLTAVRPSARLPISRDPWLRSVDWVAPLGLGQRGLLVGVPRETRTEVLRHIATAFSVGDSVEVTVLLCGDRPEEITAWREDVNVQVIATPFDQQPSRQVHVASIVFERAKRRAERGHEVLLLVDSLTRLYNACCADNAASSSPRGTGGLDPAAVYKLRRWLGGASDLRGAGSVTVLATLNGGEGDPIQDALLRELGELINWKLTLKDTGAGGRMARPQVDIRQSWTRHEHLLLSHDELERRHRWRRTLPRDGADEDEALSVLFPAAQGDMRLAAHADG